MPVLVRKTGCVYHLVSHLEKNTQAVPVLPEMKNLFVAAGGFQHHGEDAGLVTGDEE